MKTIALILAIPLGIFMVVFGEYDDSPGGMLLGMVLVIIGVVGLIKRKK